MYFTMLVSFVHLFNRIGFVQNVSFSEQSNL